MKYETKASANKKNNNNKMTRKETKTQIARKAEQRESTK